MLCTLNLVLYAYLGPIQIHIFTIKKWVVVKIIFFEIALKDYELIHFL